MPRSFPAALLVGIAATLAGCGSEQPQLSPAEQLSDAVAASTEAGPSRAVVSTQSGFGTYTVVGNIDPGDGSRFCGEIVETPRSNSGYGAGGHLYVSGRAGKYETLIKLGSRLPPNLEEADEARLQRGCLGERWFDDHPPTLPLYAYSPGLRLPVGGDVGAESYFQLALLALTEFEAGAGSVTERRDGVYEVEFNFPAADEEPKARNEDRWQMEPLIESAGIAPVRFERRDGLISQIALTAPAFLKRDGGGSVEVKLKLDQAGEGEPVPRAQATVME